MSFEKDFQDAMKRFGERGVSTFPATVVNVDKSKGTCSVKAEELTFEDVRLASVITGDNEKFFLYPSIGSSVLVSPINEDALQLYVEVYGEVEQFKLVIGDTEVDIDSKGFHLKRQNETLRGLILELIAAIKTMKFTTNTGPTIQLINLPTFEALEPRFKTLLKEV